MADLTTSFGEFIPKYYEPVHNEKGQKLGVNLYLEFKPGERVFDATKIAFTQVGKGEKKGKPVSFTKHRKKETMLREGPHEGHFIDQDAEFQNPLYATGSALDTNEHDAQNKLEGYEDDEVSKMRYSPSDLDNLDFSNPRDYQLWKDTNYGLLVDRAYKGYGEFGYRYASMSSTSGSNELFTQKNASIQDTPHFTRVYKDSSEKFESAVVVADGAQQGLYLGSVTWGWERTSKDDSGFKKLPIEVKSQGAPSEVFFSAAEKWNQAKAYKKKKKDGKETVDLPMSLGSVLVDNLSFYSSLDDVENESSEKLNKGTECRMVDEVFNPLDNKYYYKVRVLNGDESKSGYVPVQIDGKPTIDDSGVFSKWPGL